MLITSHILLSEAVTLLSKLTQARDRDIALLKALGAEPWQPEHPHHPLPHSVPVALIGVSAHCDALFWQLELLLVQRMESLAGRGLAFPEREHLLNRACDEVGERVADLTAAPEALDPLLGQILTEELGLPARKPN